MGPYAKNIYIESDAALGKNIKLTLKGNAVALLKVEPSNFIYMGALKAGSKSVWKFKISCSNPETELALPVLPEDAPYVAGFVSGSSTFVAGENQKYLCLQGCAWAGTIGIVTVDNISLKEVR